MKLPNDQKQIIVTNGINAIEGYISYTKNIDLDEKGYIKLAPPMLKIFSEVAAEGGDADFDFPVTIFPWTNGSYKVITPDLAFNFALSTMTFTEDSGTPQYHDKSRVINWVGGDWYIGADDIYDYTGATGTSVYTSRINIQLNNLELFTNKNTIVGNNTANVLKQYNTAYANTTDLTLPANFVITGTAYSNNLMGVATRQGKNQGNAYFFTWDGASTSANSGYPINDSYILSVKAYKSSWVIFTSAGQLLYFNGGGWNELGSIPSFRFEDDLLSLGPSNTIDIGDIMDVDGDIIYVNCASLPEFSMTNKPYRPGFSGGMYCYDPEVGFYHRFAPSYSRYAPADVTASSNVLTFSENHFLRTGDEVWLKATDLGLTGPRTYYVINISPTTIKLADTYDDAVANTSLSITNGTLNNLFYTKRMDYGVDAVGIRNLGLVKKARDYEGFDLSGIVPTFLGADIHPNTVASNPVSVLCAAVPGVSNIGYVITSKFQSQNLDDTWQGVAIKHSKLSQQSSIVVKAKVKDQEAIIVGDMNLFDTSYTGPSVTWDANGKYFETTFDLSEAEVGDEVYVFDGAGAGQSSFITDIDTTGSIYQVTLDEEIRGVTSNAKSCVSIEKWVKLGTITPANSDGVKYLALGKPSPTLEIKCELKGIGVKISEIIPVNITHKKK